LYAACFLSAITYFYMALEGFINIIFHSFLRKTVKEGPLNGEGRQPRSASGIDFVSPIGLRKGLAGHVARPAKAIGWVRVWILDKEVDDGLRGESLAHNKAGADKFCEWVVLCDGAGL
jgi:hypothetical protein